MLCDDVRLQSDVRLGTTAGCRVHGTCLLVRGTGWVIRINGNQAGVCNAEVPVFCFFMLLANIQAWLFASSQAVRCLARHKLRLLAGLLILSAVLSCSLQLVCM